MYLLSMLVSIHSTAITANNKKDLSNSKVKLSGIQRITKWLLIGFLLNMMAFV